MEIILSLVLVALSPVPIQAQLRDLSSFSQDYTRKLSSDQTPIKPKRDISASVAAHSWPSSIFSPLCEAFAYLDKTSSIGNEENEEKNVGNLDSWSFLDAIVKKGGIDVFNSWVGDGEHAADNTDNSVDSDAHKWGYINSTNLAIESALTLNSLDQNLLPLALALRAYAPTCEMHRTLARDAAIAYGLYSPYKGDSVPPAAFAIVSRVTHSKEANKTIALGRDVVVNEILLESTLVQLEALSVPKDDETASATPIVPEQKPQLLPLPGETYHPEVIKPPPIDYDNPYWREEVAKWNEIKDETVAILYGQVGTTSFNEFYNMLKDQKIKFVVRHMGHIAYEEEMKTNIHTSRAIPTALQGYGVRLDIRNVEYKAFDDGPSDKADGDTKQTTDWSDSMHDPKSPARNEYLAGVNLHKIMNRIDAAETRALPDDLQSLQTALLQSHPAQQSSESIVPPAWKRRSLSMQAATAIVSSADPLSTLQGISQNLPSVAHALSSIQVDDTFKTLAQEATDLSQKVGAVSPGWGDAPFGFYVNSREVNVERYSFNIFQLLDAIREEDKKLRELESNVRPVLEAALGVLMGDGRGKGTAFKVLKNVRKGMDMGLDRLIELGKEKEDSTIAESSDTDDMYMNEPAEAEKQYRIDVARGGKKAVVYLNNLEKDPEYQSWPSVEEMMMRMQFGQGPAARRNLFTLLIVVDPASGKGVHPAINILAQLINSQFPVRIGLLIVSHDDIAEKKASKPKAFENGNRPFHASDALTMIKHISKKYGGMTAMSVLANVFQPHDGNVITVQEYINSYVAFLIQMGVVMPEKESFIQQEIKLILTFPEDDEDGYEQSFDFAVQKLLEPGMSFFNGIPFPEASDPNFGIGVNKILQYEQSQVINRVFEGKITDAKPKSVYAMLLTGDNIHSKFHPLLRTGTVAKYAPMSTAANDLSLIIPSNKIPADVDAFFVVEAVVDVDSIDGINSAKAFLDLIHNAPEQWHDSKDISVVFRIVIEKEGIKGDPTKGGGLSSLFCSASRLKPNTLKRAIETIIDAPSYLTAINELTRSNDFFEDSREVLKDITTYVSRCSNKGTLDDTKNYYTINGRVYSPIEGALGPFLTVDDVKMLISMELDKTVGMTKLILPKLLPKVGKEPKKESTLAIHNAVTLSITALNHMFSQSESSALSQFSQRATSSIVDMMEKVESSGDRNALYLSWNEEYAKKKLQVEVSVILDPLTEPTQRVAPLLLAIRDHLKIPLKLLIAPRQIVENSLPLSSYYRFTLDPLAVPDTNPPAALFTNLPLNHLLTVRLDVPETFDVQQHFAVQDADNLRCDAKYGCADEAYILANNGGKLPDDSQGGGIELTQIEYTLKSLLFFGQCYDATTGSPPNGLQLTLNKSRLPNQQSASEIQIHPDGSTSQIVDNDQVDIDAWSRDHTDTLVMKTVGYWQLRANPGMWDLTLADRGAQIYHMVKGSVTPFGRLIVDKDSDSFMTKSLIMKDFSDHRELLIVKRNVGHESDKLYLDEADIVSTNDDDDENETVHVFSLATGHAYERLLKIMMLSVTKRTKSPVKFWLFENFLSPSFKESAMYMAEKIGCELEFVTYKWPEWLRAQSEKQRIIWGYKILFLDVLFPLDIKKIIYVDADQVIRGDLTELWNLSLEGAPYGYTPFCDSREETLGYQFWRSGFWATHLRGKPYHISALYVVDLERFRRETVGDKLRAHYQQLSADPNSLANLDQDLPNYCQHDVKIFSLPQKWLWCESWCSDETKAEAMTIDLCNNPEHKEAKISMAKRIISGPLFEESWEQLDDEVSNYYQDYLTSRQ